MPMKGPEFIDGVNRATTLDQLRDGYAQLWAAMDRDEFIVSEEFAALSDKWSTLPGGWKARPPWDDDQGVVDETGDQPEFKYLDARTGLADDLTMAEINMAEGARMKRHEEALGLFLASQPSTKHLPSDVREEMFNCPFTFGESSPFNYGEPADGAKFGKDWVNVRFMLNQYDAPEVGEPTKLMNLQPYACFPDMDSTGMPIVGVWFRGETEPHWDRSYNPPRITHTSASEEWPKDRWQEIVKREYQVRPIGAKTWRTAARVPWYSRLISCCKTGDPDYEWERGHHFYLPVSDEGAEIRYRYHDYATSPWGQERVNSEWSKPQRITKLNTSSDDQGPPWMPYGQGCDPGAPDRVMRAADAIEYVEQCVEYGIPLGSYPYILAAGGCVV